MTNPNTLPHTILQIEIGKYPSIDLNHFYEFYPEEALYKLKPEFRKDDIPPYPLY
jgi:hypothetical protein